MPEQVKGWAAVEAELRGLGQVHLEAGRVLDDHYKPSEHRHGVYRAYDHAADLVAAERRRAEQAEGWRDIASAPKNETLVLLYADAWSGTWGSVQSGYVHDGAWSTVEGTVDVSDVDYGPTHWRPLPAPPIPDAVGEEE